MAGPTATTPVIWLKADAQAYKDNGVTLAANNDTVQLWKDQSGNGNDVSQATAGLRPTFKTGILNNLPAIQYLFTNQTQLGTAGSVAHNIGTGDFWYACVIGLTSSTGFNTSFSVGSFAPAFYFPHNGNNGTPDFYLGGSHDFAATVANGTQWLFEMVRVSGVVKCYLSQGGAAVTQDANTFSIASNIANAILYSGNDNANEGMTGNIMEQLLYNVSLSAGEQAQLEAYLLLRWWNVGVKGSGVMLSHM